MSKHDLQTWPVYHHQHHSTEAHLTIVFAVLAVSRWIEGGTRWSIRKFVCTARRYKTIEIQAGSHSVTAADPVSHDVPTPSTASTDVQVRTNVSQLGWPSSSRVVIAAPHPDPAGSGNRSITEGDQYLSGVVSLSGLSTGASL